MTSSLFCLQPRSAVRVHRKLGQGVGLLAGLLILKALPAVASDVSVTLPIKACASVEVAVAAVQIVCDRLADSGALPMVSFNSTVNASPGDNTNLSFVAEAAESTELDFAPTAAISQANFSPSAQTVEVDPAIIESSPVLRRWLQEVPDIAVDIQHDPAFRTRVRVGYAEFPSSDNTGGYYVGVQDIFVGRTPLTFSAEYARNSRGDREIYGADAQYYLLPLGWYGNVAPVLGYRSINNSSFNSEGINVGFKIILVPSRTGAADLSFTQSWVSPGTAEEVGLTTFSAGYAIADDIRVGTDIQTQNSRDRQESRVSLLLEWMP